MAPEGWRAGTLRDVCSFEYGKSLPAGARRAGRIPVFGSNGAVGTHDEALVPGPGIVIGRKGSIGEVAWCDGDFWPIDTTYWVERRAAADLRWLFYVLGALNLRGLNTATGIPGLNREDAYGLSVGLPPLGEQRKIAAILSSVDDAIEATQAVIDQLQVVKKAMMAELLTRGLPGRHTRFKMTEIGEVPEEWEVVELGSVLASIDSGWSPQCESRPALQGEWGVLKVSAVTSGVYLDSEQKALPSTLAPRPGAEVRDGDVLLARANGVLELVGRTVLVRATRPRLMLSDKLLRLRPAPSRLDAEYLSLVMATEVVRSRLLSTTGGSHMRNVSQANLRVLLLPLPRLEEQVRVATAIGGLDERVKVEFAALSALRSLKAALMSVLLTGEVRVKPDEEAA